MAKVLVAEDDKFLGEAYKTKLTSAGYEVKLVADGEEALRELIDFAPAVVILDLKMAKADGFYFLESLGKSAQPHPPIIVASNSGDKTDIDRAMKLGATDYVVKSNLSMKGLIEKIQLILQPKNQVKT
ncbi:hypothetical protein A2803_05095 [Candidatus Woesebacteria bacterium RIFCSPHIGHO2_01_FULL_44_21]|uniref:Response regulatory domain-containing protein n=1 Tax=Candidatus Woesebacteria bacterium RIFCSPHIGHO2_01_FULL_44_21 TaxID=1802503 RepID=A0A1F7Z063_9BACT|nr:MAG: hypothetical protein A2803_05095 [Candidatus Woesebacteria bacterium RIFCSPHIGHO2_01_FULL_44_21]OGM68888.1 MAG: hypothetical protein A2897_01880 [Candidatus Woesebacteria bacterium RIFCSPLOWO2_01_FULL_44_24b]